MPKEGYSSITVKDEDHDLLETLSKNVNKTMSETLHSLLMGEKFPKGLCLNFSTEYVCSNCGYRAAGPTQTCPICKSLISVRYLKQ